MLYRLVLVMKLAAVMVYGGGHVASLVASSADDRRRAVHKVASPALLAIWTTGYALVSMIDIALTELWVVAALALSTLSHVALVHRVQRDRRTAGSFLVAAVPLAAVVALMVFRPTWSSLRGS